MTGSALLMLLKWTVAVLLLPANNAAGAKSSIIDDNDVIAFPKHNKYRWRSAQSTYTVRVGVVAPQYRYHKIIHRMRRICPISWANRVGLASDGITTGTDHDPLQITGQPVDIRW